jgi:hypothetical protein
MLAGLKLPLLALAGLISGLGAAHAGSSWSGTINCSYGSGSLNIQVDDHGAVSGGMTNGTIRYGTLSGSSIKFTFSNAFGNTGLFSGTVSGRTMSGTYTQSAGTQNTCSWQASLVGNAPAANTRSKDSTREREIAEAKGLVERGKIVQRQPGCESQRLAAQLLADASVIYRRLGMAGNSDKINAAADKLTGEGGTYYKCLAKRSKSGGKTVRKTKPDQSASQRKDAREVAKVCRDLTAYANKLEREGHLEASLKVKVKIRLECDKRGR